MKIVVAVVLLATIGAQAQPARECPQVTYSQTATELDGIAQTLTGLESVINDHGRVPTAGAVARQREFVELLAYCMRQTQRQYQDYVDGLIRGAEQPTVPNRVK